MVINIVATEIPAQIVRGLPAAFAVEEALQEVFVHPRTGKHDHSLPFPLLNPCLTRVALSDAELKLFVELTGAAPPDDLDDGEAATLAHAIMQGMVCVVDEKKARRIVRARFAEVECWSTIDLFRHVQSSGAIAANDLDQALYDSLRFARMRVPAEHRAWVVGRIGVERAATCPSLGRVP